MRLQVHELELLTKLLLACALQLAKQRQPIQLPNVIDPALQDADETDTE